MNGFRSWPIRRKLMSLMVFVSTVVVGVACLGFVVFQSSTLLHWSLSHVSTLARVVGSNCAAALTFNDEKAAQDTLDSLVMEPNVRAALVLKPDGSVFASYIRPGGDEKEILERTMKELEETVHRQGETWRIILEALEDGDLEVLEEIYTDGEPVGRIFICQDMASLYNIALKGVGIGVGLLLMSLFLAYIMAWHLHSFVSRPVLALRNVMLCVSRDKNYSLRAKKESDDELGSLVDGFNEMLAQIQERDFELEQHRRHLENLVAKRTEELQRANAELEETVEQLKVAKEEAEAASRAKSQFLANMSHEIRTPLNGVLGMVELLLQTPLNERQKHLVDMIRSSGQALLTVINDVLDFSKIEAGRMEINSMEFELKELVEEATAIFAGQAHSKGLELVCVVDPEVPARVWGDPDRVRQVLINLIGNAVKFTERGEVVCRVYCASSQGNHAHLTFEVRDTGIGIPKDKQKIIFDPFSQVDGSTTRRFGGTGLGLAIARHLVELMGGTMELESELGRGSVFRFRLTMPVGAWKPSMNGEALRTLQGLRALVVDDYPINRQILCHTLTGWGMVCDEAENGHQALERVRNMAAQGILYDVVFLDMDMPDMNGLELACNIKKMPQCAGVELVMLSSMQVASNKTNQEHGIRHFLTKPVRTSSLYNCLITLFRDRKSRMSAVETSRDVIPKAASPIKEIAPGRKVLVVEDNQVNQEFCRGLLELFGCQVDIACNGLQALDKLRKETYDLVFMDCQMPEMDGYEATREFRKMEAERSGVGRRTPVVALTAHATLEDREKCLAAGMDDYLSKPFKIEQMRAILEKYLRMDSVRETGEGKRLEESASRVTGTVDAEVLDMKVIESIRSLHKPGRENLLHRMIRLYLQRSPELIEEMRQSLKEGDMVRLQRAAHTLKSTSASMGIQRVAKLSLDLELMASKNRLEEPEQLIDSIEQEFLRARPHLEALLQEETNQ